MPKLMKGFIDLREGDAQVTFPAISWPAPQRIALGIETITRDRLALATCTDGPDGLRVLYATEDEPLTLYVGIVRGSRLMQADEATFGHAWLGGRTVLLSEAVATMATRRWESWRRAAVDAEREASRIVQPIFSKLHMPDS